MASGEGGVLPDTLQEPGAAEARDGAENSPFRPHPSPQLSRRTLDELGEKNEDADDPENYPLNSPWAFWFDRSPKGGTTSDFFANLRQICVVKTIKAFWCVFNNLAPVDQLNERESYHLMRDEGRRPVWEDEMNAHGGIWTFKVKKDATAAIWQEVLLAAVGEQFTANMDESDAVCGVSVRIRGYDNTIQIWNQDSEVHSKSSVIQKIKELIPNMEINEFYQSNRSKMQDSLRKPVYGGYGHKRFSPPPAGRYTGAPPPIQPPMFMRPPYQLGGPRYSSAYPQHRHPPPMMNRPYLPQPRSQFPAP